MSDNSKSYVRVAFATIAMAALGVHPALRSSGAAENERSSENASNTGDFIQPSVAGEVSSDVSGLSASSNDDALRAQLAELTTRLEQSPDDVDALVARAALYSHLKDAEKEQTDLLKAMKLSPDNAVAWHLYGYECLNREFTHLAIGAFEKAAGLGSNDPHLFMRLGYAYSTVGKQQEAIANYTRAIEIKTDYGEAYFSRALVWNGMAEWDKAIADIDKAIEIGYRTWPIFFERGRAYQGRGDIEQAIASFTLAIEQRPDDATSHFGRAQMRYRSGDFKNAIADLDRAIEIEPGNAYYRACRGMAYFDQKDFDKGTADVLEAIRLNPGDLFVEYQLTTNKELSPEALKHGEEQLRNMLRDCPAMAQFVSPQDKLWQWAVRKFAGEDLGAPVHWDPTPPSLRLGCSLFGDQHAIRVSQIRFDLPDRRPCTFDELWSTAVFELHNVTSSPIWSDISQQVLDGKLNRDDYIVAVLESEELATQRTRAFYLKFYLPWIREKGMVDTSPARWRCGSFIPDADPQSRLAYWQKHSLWPLYAASYDHLLAQREYSQSNYDEVVKLLQALVTKDNLLEK
jgi:tetratricopeptide (TPR) repeat protein